MYPNQDTNAHVLLGLDEINNAILQFISHTELKYDVCTDYNTSLVLMKNEDLRKAIFELKDRGAYLRLITEITKDSIEFWKRAMKYFEVRHLNGIKYVFRVNETEYQSVVTLGEEEEEEGQERSKPSSSSSSSVLIYSNKKDTVKNQQILFNTLWDKAVPAEQRIREFEKTPTNLVLTSTDMQDNKKIKRMIQNITSDTHTIKKSQKIQLWTNEYQNEYAIRLEGSKSKLLAATKYDVDYTKIVDESDYLEELEYNWNYTLQCWIDSSRSSNKSNNNEKTISNEIRTKTKLYNSQKNLLKYKGNRKITYNQKTPPLKCHFCKLAYFTHKERRKHEQEWHGSNNKNLSE